MKRFLVLFVAGAIAAAVASGGSGSVQACKPGVRSVGKILVRTFCGPAKASLTVGGKPQAFRQGSCTRLQATFTINIGTITIGKAKPKYDYFGISIAGANHDGNYPRAAIGWAYHGRRYAAFNAKLKLAGNRTRGTFSGRVVSSKATVKGSFSCK
jgi:hypothetical protein